MTHFRDCRHNLVKYSPQDVRAMVTFSANQSINQGSWNHPHDIASTRSLPVHSANLHDMFEKTVFQAKVEKIFFYSAILNLKVSAISWTNWHLPLCPQFWHHQCGPGAWTCTAQARLALRWQTQEEKIWLLPGQPRFSPTLWTSFLAKTFSVTIFDFQLSYDIFQRSNTGNTSLYEWDISIWNFKLTQSWTHWPVMEL